MRLLMTLWLLMMFPHPSTAQNDRGRQDWGNLARYEQENRVLMKSTPDPRRVVFMGNSITEGWQRLDSGFFRSNGFVNRGISGQTTSQMLVRFRSDVIDLKPAVVVILAGTNDIAENTGPISLEDVFGNIVSMAQLARANGIQVILSSVLPALDFPWRPGLKPADKIVTLNTMISGYCRSNNIPYVDYYSHMVDEQKGLRKDLSDDGVHPTLSGYNVMGPLVMAAIETIRKQK